MTRNVLFVCNRNAIRSPMAAALLNSMEGTAESAGVSPGQPDPLSQTAMEEVGLCFPQGPRPVDMVKLGRFDLVIALSPQAHHRMLEMTRNTRTPVEYWPVPDPSLVDGSREMRLAAYRAVREELLKKLKDRFRTGG